MENTKDFWNLTWSRPYGRYNRHHVEIWQTIMPLIKGSVIDLGVGTAFMYQGQNLNLTGVDWSETGIEEAKKNYPQGNFSVQDLRNTNFEDKSFDTCILAGILDYFSDWNEVIKEARRITKGNIIATLLQGFNKHNWSDIKYPVLGKVGNWIIIKI